MTNASPAATTSNPSIVSAACRCSASRRDRQCAETPVIRCPLDGKACGNHALVCSPAPSSEKQADLFWSRGRNLWTSITIYIINPTRNHMGPRRQCDTPLHKTEKVVVKRGWMTSQSWTSKRSGSNQWTSRSEGSAGPQVARCCFRRCCRNPTAVRCGLKTSRRVMVFRHGWRVQDLGYQRYPDKLLPFAA